MKRPSFRKLLGFSVLGLLLLVLGGLALLGTRWGRRQIEHQVREQLARRSDLVLAPFTVDFSFFREFPHLTASIHHLSLTDTSNQRAVPVLRVGRADMRLALRPLLRGRLVISHLTLRDTDFRQYTDSAGHDWSLRGSGPRREEPKAPPDFYLHSLTLINLRVSDRNERQHSGFAAFVRRGQLVVRTLDGVAHVGGGLDGQLVYLRSGRGNLFEREPVRAWVNYRYNFRERLGTFFRTRATLNHDTVHISGTHQGAAPGEPRGTRLNLVFDGRQPLVPVLRVALPAGLQPFIAEARSPSHAHIRYTIRGVSGPTARPRTVLRFALRNAQVLWPDSARRIRRWDALGVFDNGPAHAPRTTYLTFEQCRIYSSAGELAAALTVSDFRHPTVHGRVQGRTELQNLAAVVAPGLWKARHGVATLDVRLNGPLPRQLGQHASAHQLIEPLAVRGSVRLQDASYTVPGRGVDMRNLNVRVQLRDSSWRLENLTATLNGMSFRANATTSYLLAYFSGQHPTTTITGTFAVDELRIDRLRRMTARPAGKRHPSLTDFRPDLTSNQALAARAVTLLPPGLRLNIHLKAGRLSLPADTIYHMAATVRHDGKMLRMSNVQARLWGGTVRGAVSWPTDTLNLRPVAARLNLRFGTLNYQRLLAAATRPSRRARSAPADPTLREVLLAANGQVHASIDALQLHNGEKVSNLRLRIDKQGRDFKVGYLNFETNAGGQGHIFATARLEGTHLASANADMRLHYANLDVQRLLRLLSALTPPARPGPDGRRGSRPPTDGPAAWQDGTLTATVHVTADQVRYGALRGSRFRLRSSLEPGLARLQSCALQAFGGEIALHGRLLTDAGAGHHPLFAQLQMQNIQLPALFRLGKEVGFDVLGPDNVRGTMRCEADLKSDLEDTFLPHLSRTHAYVATDLHELELLEVEALMEALKFLRDKRTGHLYFEPVSPRFVLNGGQLLIPPVSLSSNLTDLVVSGEYGLLGPTNLYVGLSPLQTLFGNNEKRIARIQSGEAARQPSRGLIYVNLRRTPGSPYKVRLFKKNEQRTQQQALEQQYRHVLRTQRLDTTLRMVQ